MYGMSLRLGKLFLGSISAIGTVCIPINFDSATNSENGYCEQ